MPLSAYPGHLDDVNVGMKVLAKLDLANKRPAAKLGHADVGEEDVMAGEFESVQGTLRFQDLMGGRAQVFRYS
jgi:hypothetical protein